MTDSKQDQTEFAELLRREQSRLYGYIHSLVRDLNDTDDLFQQVALVLWRKFDSFDQERSFFAWACGVARLEAANFLRGRGRDRLYFSDELNLLLIEAHVELSNDETEARRQALAGCVDKLRERDRALLLECYGDAPGVHAAAGRSGRSPQSVYNSLRRIRRSLFACVRRALERQARTEWLT